LEFDVVAVARGSSVLAKSVNPARIRTNLESLVALDEDDMKILNSYSSQLQKEGKLMRYVYPSFGVDFGFPDKS
jgi:diketogulonate reductase-like aldo/keto reductase